jgi:SAM-dependent methyltransferase
LFDDLVDLAQLRSGARLLEIGCATGKATLPLVRRGFEVVCVELSADLAVRARANLAGYPVTVDVASFEHWDPGNQLFDLVYAATAWHWIDPALRYGKAHELLVPGGHVAFWSAGHGFPEGFDPFFTEIQPVYDAIGESHEGEWPPSPPAQMPTDVAEIEQSGLFHDVRVRRYVWEVVYTAEEYIALLDTFSGHIAMPPEKREVLYGAIRDTLAERPDGSGAQALGGDTSCRPSRRSDLIPYSTPVTRPARMVACRNVGTAIWWSESCKRLMRWPSRGVTQSSGQSTYCWPSCLQTTAASLGVFSTIWGSALK